MVTATNMMTRRIDMRTISAAVAIFVLVGCGHAQRRIGRREIYDMKKQGLTEQQILRQVEVKEVVLTITDDDVVALLEAGFSEETINALLARARDVQSSKHH
jgi:hypothetical protein